MHELAQPSGSSAPNPDRSDELTPLAATDAGAIATVPDLLTPCRDEDELWNWVEAHLGLRVPRTAFCAGHSAPFEYLRRAYFEPAGDLVVWGPRGGGKTRLAAAATLLDLLHKPGVVVRILGGSLEQSLRVWEHLLPDLERLAGEELVKSRSRSRRADLASGASAAVLTQSQRAVRGQRVQKMRCDEVELFDPAVWEAVGATTRSRLLPDGRVVRGVVEALSTHHRGYGLMATVLHRADTSGTPVIRWCILDVMARCEPERDCGTCPLFAECRGRAKSEAHGFVSVDDVIALKRRVSEETWQSELLCNRPSRQGRVFPGFSFNEHVAPFEADVAGVGEWHMGIDFGYRNPFVALWISRGRDGRLYVIDEYVKSERVVIEHAAELRRRTWRLGQLYCDPAGQSRSEQTGKSSVKVLRDAGFTVSTKRSEIIPGIERIRMLIRPAFGSARLVVHPRCVTLIRALSEYHYAEASDSEQPHKDGVHDHPIDALRYYLASESAKEASGSRSGY